MSTSVIEWKKEHFPLHSSSVVLPADGSVAFSHRVFLHPNVSVYVVLHDMVKNSILHFIQIRMHSILDTTPTGSALSFFLTEML